MRDWPAQRLPGCQYENGATTLHFSSCSAPRHGTLRGTVFMNGNTSKYPGLNLGSAHGADDDAAEILLLGFWLFLMSDAILFGLVFATYLTLAHATAGGPGPSDLYDLTSVFTQTMLLLASSFTFGMASLALKY